MELAKRHDLAGAAATVVVLVVEAVAVTDVGGSRLAGTVNEIVTVLTAILATLALAAVACGTATTSPPGDTAADGGGPVTSVTPGEPLPARSFAAALLGRVAVPQRRPPRRGHRARRSTGSPRCRG